MSSPQFALTPPERADGPDSPETGGRSLTNLLDAPLLLALSTGLRYFVGATRIQVAREILGITTFGFPAKEECLMSEVLTLIVVRRTRLS